MSLPIPPCLRCKSPLEAGDLRCAVCGGRTPFEVAHREEIISDVLRCQGCGAAVEYDAEVQGLKCAFCDSILALERIEDPMEQTEAWLPFTITKEAATSALKEWLGRQGFFAPSDLKESARLHELRPLFWVGWVFRARALVSWTADSDAGSQNSEWAPHTGQTSLVFDDIVVSASRGLSDREAYGLVDFYDLSTQGERPTGAQAEGHVFEQFDVQRSQARSRVLDAVNSVAAEMLERGGHIPGRKYRKISVVPLLEGLETRRIAFPAFVMAYRYDDKVYRAVICGQRASRVIGKAPTSLFKVAMVVLGVGLLLLLIFAMVAAGGR